MNISDDTYEKSYTYLYGSKVCNKIFNLYSYKIQGKALLHRSPSILTLGRIVLTLYRCKLKILKIPY